MQRDRTALLIIGAGPYGLSVAAWARRHGLDHLVVGKSMGSWIDHMPAGMFLRSGSDWQLDPAGEWTLLAWLAERGQRTAGFTPISLESYLAYAAWFMAQAGIAIHENLAVRLDALANGGFLATMDNGDQIEAKRVVVAAGFQYFPVIPVELAKQVPTGKLVHTSDFVGFGNVMGQRFLIVGGRQSAYEWAALLAEAGARSVDIVHRHPSPRFQEADWSWVLPVVDAMVQNPRWYRDLAAPAQQEINSRLWGEGRLKVEPWLEERIANGHINVRANTSVLRCRLLPDGSLRVDLSDGARIEVDQVVAATGYEPGVARVPFLANGNLAGRLNMDGSFAALDEAFQTSAPGLYLTSMLATRAFGPFFAFTVAAPASANIIGLHIVEGC